MSTDAKRQLVDFRVKRAFDPVMTVRHAELKELKFPSINDIRDEPEKEASALGVGA